MKLKIKSIYAWKAWGFNMTDTKKETPTGLALLREPFEKHHISKLPKPTRRQTDEVKADFSKGIRCNDCGGWHHPKVVHLDYVGHAALTDRLLDCDPLWNWEPMALTEAGLPLIDGIGGMWIKLTVCDVTRLGYGNADGKTGGNAIKEVIGDALRNAAMRFGAALDLWHKGDLHIDEDEAPQEKQPPKKQPEPTPEDLDLATQQIKDCEDMGQLQKVFGAIYANQRHVAEHADIIAAKDRRKGELQ